MAATEMYIMKIYIKMHSTIFFFSKNIKHVTAVCWEFCQKILLTITNVLSVSVYDTRRTKLIVKNVCWKNECYILPNKKFRLVLSYISIFVRNAS